MDHFFSKKSHIQLWWGCSLAQKERIKLQILRPEAAPTAEQERSLSILSEGRTQGLEVQVKSDAIKGSIIDWKLQLFKKTEFPSGLSL